LTGAEQGFLLLTSCLGDPDRKPLTVPQIRELRNRIAGKKADEPDREMVAEDLLRLGYRQDMAERILSLLGERERMARYVSRAARKGCVVITPVSSLYPQRLMNGLGGECPGCIWAKGELSLLGLPAISLVGSRELYGKNEAFSREVGKQAALQGYVLISGNARGADRCAQDACLEHGGKVISIVADELDCMTKRDGMLYLSEDGFDLPFTAQRALSRNRLIHAMGEKTFVAQSSFQTGGTWSGTANNLKRNMSPVFVFDDGSLAARELIQMGAAAVTAEELKDIRSLQKDTFSLF